MGGFISKPVIVEFNGLPGSGKTSTAKELKSKLELLGCQSSFNFLRSGFYRFNEFVLLDPKYWSLVKTIFIYSMQLKKHEHTIKYVLSIVNWIRKYQYFIKCQKNGVLIVDQGFVQGIISLAHQEKLPQTGWLDKILKASRIDTMPLILVNCNVDATISDNRIMGRPKNGCRVESMEKDERMRTLLIQKENFVYLMERVATVCPQIVCADVNTERTVLENVDIIIRGIEKVS